MAHLKITAALLTACGVLSCQIAPLVSLYNNSSAHYVAKVLDESYVLAPNSKVEFAYPYSANGGFRLAGDDCDFIYSPPEPPTSVEPSYRLLREHLRVQLEPDGKIYLLPSGAVAPVEASTLDQPAEFPIVPLATSNC